MLSNIKKAYYYMQRNGIEDTLYASLERLSSDGGAYNYAPVGEVTEELQRKKVFSKLTTFSVVVPAFETDEEFMKALIQSMLNQTYPAWELIIADASETDKVSKTVSTYTDSRIQYVRLTGNGGISKNTNAALRIAKGDYIGLLDHDDLLTSDCLFEFASLIEEGAKNRTEYAFIYSDEDKCDGTGTKFFEPNIKPGFNLDLLLSNNYICHFAVYRADILKFLKLRKEFDGAQDHDLLLRTYAYTHERAILAELEYGHIPKVLYHWRCHEASTASNPASKSYAYDAGRRCVEDFLKCMGVNAEVKPTKHNGFFRVEYIDRLIYPKGSKAEEIKLSLTADRRGQVAYNTLLNRYDIGLIGGPIYNKNKITGGILDNSKTCPYDGLNKHFSGYLHRAVLQQDALGLDVRNMIVAEALVPTFVQFAQSEQYMQLFNQNLINVLKLRMIGGELGAPFIDVNTYLVNPGYEDIDYTDAGFELCRLAAMEGYISYYDPEFA